MAIVKYATGIDYVKGSLAKPKKVNGHNDGTYLIGTHREAESQNPNCKRLFVRAAETYKRTTPIKQNEAWARMRFTNVAKAVKERRNNLAQISTDQQNFVAQKNEANGYKTMKAYLWALEGATYDEQHPRG